MTEKINNACEFNIETTEKMLEMAKSEYDNEHKRTSILDTKASIALPILFAFFFALVQMSDLSSIFCVQLLYFKQCLIVSIVFISYILSCFAGGIAMFLMVRVISTRNYNVIKTSDLYDEDYLKEESVCFCLNLIRLYCEATENNKMQNDKRVGFYKKGLIFMFVSIVLFSVFIILKNNFM